MKKAGAIQNAILDELAASAQTRAELQDKLTPISPRSDNISRSLANLVSRGAVLEQRSDLRPSSKDVFSLAGGFIGLAAPNQAFAWSARSRREYTGLTRALMALSRGVPLTYTEIFHTKTVNAAFAQRVLERLLGLGVVVPAPGERYQIGDAKSRRWFKDVWADEKKFCAVGDWPCAEKQAEHMSLLLSGRGSLRQEAVAAAYLFLLLGQENISRRTGLSAQRLSDLRRVSTIPSAAQEAMETRGLPPSWVRATEAEWTEEEFLSAIMADAPPGPGDTGDDNGGDVAVHGGPLEEEAISLEDMVAACLKLCSFTAETVSRLEPQIAFLARELGYRGE